MAMSTYASITGGAGNDYIVNKANENYNYALSKWETITSPDNVTILGGNGNDTFIYKPGEGTDKIYDYAAGDKFNINGKSYTIKGSTLK